MQKLFVLWSGDSDFAYSIMKLMSAGKKVILFATARKISKELSALVAQGLMVFDIQKIRPFICWKKELERKGDPDEGPPSTRISDLTIVSSIYPTRGESQELVIAKNRPETR